MFAYAELDRAVVDVVCAAAKITADDKKFIRRGSVDDFEREAEKYIDKHGEDVSKIRLMSEQIKCAENAYSLRNDLAHGDWWRFDPESGSISVRRDRDEDEPFREITVAEIERAVGVFKDVEAELFKIRRKIECVRTIE
jgi:hypothetical protein